MADRKSLEQALTGAHTVFAMTVPPFGPNAFEVEYSNAKTIADVAVGKGLEYNIFSTLPGVKDISKSKYTAVIPFDAKAEVEKYIRGLPIKSAFFAGGFFMENIQSQPFFAPTQALNGTWILARPNSSKTKFPYIHATRDTGKFIGAILTEPEKYEGKTFCAAEKLYSLEEIAAIISKASGKNVIYKQISVEEFKSGLAFAPDLFADGFLFGEEYGYFGPGTEELVAWAAKNARGKLASFEDFFKENILTLA